jgi:hypothetical protein
MVQPVTGRDKKRGLDKKLKRKDYGKREKF